MDVRVQVPPRVPDSKGEPAIPAGMGGQKKFFMVDVAQSVEHLVVVQKVVGSKPIVHPTGH